MASPLFLPGAGGGVAVAPPTSRPVSSLEAAGQRSLRCPSSRSVIKVANRGAGEFVGEMEVVVGSNGRFEELNDIGSDPTLRQKRQRGETQSMKNAFFDEKYMGAALAKKNNVKWVGSKRTASVRAITDVEVMVLKREDMQWVLENDEGVQGEILEAVKKGLGELQRARSESMRQRSSSGGSSKNVFDAWMQPAGPSGPTRFAPAQG